MNTDGVDLVRKIMSPFLAMSGQRTGAFCKTRAERWRRHGVRDFRPSVT